MGKGKAIRTAIDQMTGDIGIIQDADLEYDPEDYPRIISPIVDGKADAVYGSRFASSEVRRVLFFWHAMGNRVLTAFSNMANDLNLTDMETCYKAVRADLLKRLRLTSDRFGLEPEITARLARWGARIYEVPVSYHGRSYAEGKNIGWRDGVEALWLILKFKFIDTKATDDDSIVTRQALGKAPRFRRWILDEFNDHLGPRVLEVNAGPGHSTAHLLDRDLLVVTDSEPIHVETLKRRFGHLENLEVELWDFDARPLEGKAVDTAILFDGLQTDRRAEDLAQQRRRSCRSPRAHPHPSPSRCRSPWCDGPSSWPCAPIRPTGHRGAHHRRRPRPRVYQAVQSARRVGVAHASCLGHELDFSPRGERI